MSRTSYTGTSAAATGDQVRTMGRPVHPPAAWESLGLDAPGSVLAAASILRGGGVHEALADAGADESFAEAFWGRLRGPGCHVVVDVPAGMTPMLLASVVACWMGLEPAAMQEDIGGTVSHVVSGAGHRHDQSWHTDSTAWVDPNRYSVLGLVAGRLTGQESTDLLPVETLARAVAVDPAAAAALASEPITWRRNFPYLAALDAPILADPVTRWVWPVVEEEMKGAPEALRRGAALVASLLNELPFHRAIVSATQVLVFDNWRALHRGPHLERDAGRELIRIKVTGAALS